MQKHSIYTHVIWDFNGTIFDDVQLGMDCVNIMLSKRGLPILGNKETYRRVFGFPIEDYYRRVGFDFEKEDYHTVLAPEWVALYVEGEPHCRLNEGVRETMEEISARNIPQIMLSASNLMQLKAQVSRLGVACFFDEILGLDNIHARSKALLAIQWKAENPESIPLLVGDTEHDAEVAAAIGADCLLFTGGHQAEEILEAKGKPLISNITHVLKYL